MSSVDTQRLSNTKPIIYSIYCKLIRRFCFQTVIISAYYVLLSQSQFCKVSLVCLSSSRLLLRLLLQWGHMRRRLYPLHGVNFWSKLVGVTIQTSSVTVIAYKMGWGISISECITVSLTVRKCTFVIVNYCFRNYYSGLQIFNRTTYYMGHCVNHFVSVSMRYVLSWEGWFKRTMLFFKKMLCKYLVLQFLEALFYCIFYCL